MEGRSLLVGWDVGAWHCDRGASRDALVVLEGTGRPRVSGWWRGNVRATLNEYEGTQLIQRLVGLCGVQAEGTEAVFAIDTPLGWPRDFLRLLEGSIAAEIPRTKGQNPLLLRACDRLLWTRGFRPLSPVQDRIGSQSTKGLQFLAKAGLREGEAGVFSAAQNNSVIAIETYPTPCRESRLVGDTGSTILRDSQAFATELAGLPTNATRDLSDALTCAVIAWLFAHRPETLEAPPERYSLGTAWIWLPLGEDGEPLRCRRENRDAPS